MKYLILLLVIVSVPACVVNHHHAIAKGSYHEEWDTTGQLGAVASAHGADGSDYTGDAQASLNNVVQGVGAYGALKQGTIVNQSNNRKAISNSHDAVRTHAIDNPITNSTQTIDPTTGTVLTNSMTHVPKVNFGH